MQLRLCCNSPHNFYDPFPNLDLSAESDSEDDLNSKPSADGELTDYSPLITASGKMLLLDRLLRALLASPSNHKILIFSQFTTQLTLLSLYLRHLLHTPSCLITGSTPQPDRRAAIAAFNGPDSAHRVFLLSTRAGGQGINLAAADTVILFDSDWNPQQDLQAQDRAHRIGQRRNVIVYRLATRGTVEEVLLEKAEGKRRLEKLVIMKGGVKSAGKGRRARRDKEEEGNGGENGEEEDDDEVAELRRMLAKQDGQRLDVDALLTEKELAILLDRSDGAYERAEQGEGDGEQRDGVDAVFKTVQTKSGGGGLLAAMAGGK